MKRAVYTGSFDPITNGHLWVIERGAELFDELIIGIGTHPDKDYTFSLEERVDMVEASLKGIENVSVESFEHKYAVAYAREMGADYILRGVRSAEDYTYERDMTHSNSEIDDLLGSKIEPPISSEAAEDVLAVVLFPPQSIERVSSSFVKGLIGYEYWEDIVEQYVPEPVYLKFLEKFGDP